MSANAKLALTMGCPSGIGPEICARVAARERVLVVGSVAVMERAARLVGVTLPVVRAASLNFLLGPRTPDAIYVHEPHAVKKLSLQDARFGKPTRASGVAQLAYVDEACDLARDGEIDAMVTAPVSKSVIAQSHRGFVGHTEHLQERLRAREVVMAFWHPSLTTALVTNHEAIADLPRAITAQRVESAVFWLSDFLRRVHGPTPRVVVCALNPHAGESGMFGREEAKTIVPAMTRARKRLARAKIGVELTGPIGGETAFRQAKGGVYDGVVAMYHDQATIPMKLVGFGDSVNVSLGLPIVRTSVDHGTAYDIAGRGIADARGLLSAVKLAKRLVRSG